MMGCFRWIIEWF